MADKSKETQVLDTTLLGEYATQPLEPRKLDYAPDGGRYVVRGQVVDHDGKLVEGYLIVNGAIVKA